MVNLGTFPHLFFVASSWNGGCSFKFSVSRTASVIRQQAIGGLHGTGQHSMAGPPILVSIPSQGTDQCDWTGVCLHSGTT